MARRFGAPTLRKPVPEIAGVNKGVHVIHMAPGGFEEVVSRICCGAGPIVSHCMACISACIPTSTLYRQDGKADRPSTTQQLDGAQPRFGSAQAAQVLAISQTEELPHSTQSWRMLPPVIGWPKSALFAFTLIF